MIQAPKVDVNEPVIIVAIGNSNTAVATWHNDRVMTVLHSATGDQDAFQESYDAHVSAMPDQRPAAVIIGSVVPQFSRQIADFVAQRLDQDALIIGQRIPLPMDLDLDDTDAVGVDRVCAASAAYDRVQDACIVADFGTAVTVDLVDQEGVFRGGAILPGAGLQLSALARQTAQLPMVKLEVPEKPYGRNTTEAIQSGVCRGLTGAVRALVEAYATSLNRWPQVIATGGDLELLAPHCDFIDTLVKDLTLRGIGLAYTRHVSQFGL